jgi:ketosteroid isomerase-like protein
MPDDNLAVFRQWIDAYRRWDVDWMVEHVTEDVEWIPLRAATEGVFRGREGLRDFLRDTQETFESVELEYADVRDLGDRVLAIGKLRFKGKGSGLETETPSAVIVLLRDGLVAHFKDYGDPQAALKAAGLA